jgi:hypothetical protein
MKVSDIIIKYVLIIVKRFLGSWNVCICPLDSNVVESDLRSVNTHTLILPITCRNAPASPYTYRTAQPFIESCYISINTLKL